MQFNNKAVIITNLVRRRRSLGEYSRLFVKFRKVLNIVLDVLKDKKLQSYGIEKQLSIQIKSLNKICEFIPQRVPTLSVEEFLKDSHLSTYFETSRNVRLGALFESYGSDKNALGYSVVYQLILDSLPKIPINIVEIGIGSNYLDTKSNMGVMGSPGASLRAFRDYQVNANIIGLDIDTRILISEERISTFYCDQNIPQTINHALKDIQNISLMIDDGLHNLDSNMNTFKEFYAIQKVGCWIVIEDILDEPSVISAWQILAELISPKNVSYFIKCRKSILFCSVRTVDA